MYQELMSHSRGLCVGAGKKCVYANCIHMHTNINGIPVILKLAEFDSGFRLPMGDGLETRRTSQIKRRYTTCCPQCKCGSGEAASRKCLKEKTPRKSRDCISKESICSIRCTPIESISPVKSCEKKPKRCPSPKREKKPRKQYCVFKRKNAENVPTKRKAEEPKIKPKVKKIETECTYSTGSLICCPTPISRPSKEDCLPPVQIEKPQPQRPPVQKEECICPPVQQEKPPPIRPSREDWCPPEKPPPKRASREDWCPPPKRDEDPCVERSIFCKSAKKKKECTPKKIKIKKPKCKKIPTCRPVFVDAATSTASDTITRHFNLHNAKSGFEMCNKMEFTISGDTEKTTCSVDADNISSSEGIPMGNSRVDSDDVKYRFIACHLKERLTPESLVTAVSKSPSGMKNCLEATLSIYAPSLCSMAPQRFDDSNEILSTLVDNAPKDEKATETSTGPETTTCSRAFSTSTSAQTCLVDYELFKGYGSNAKVYRKDFVIEETLTNGNILLNRESSSLLG